jgi:hypothetical protein
MAVCRYEFSRCFLIFFSVGQYPAGRCEVFRAQVGEMLNAIDFQFVLFADKTKVGAEGHYKLLDILHNLLFYLALVNIGDITLSDLFHIDEVEQVIVLKHHYGFAGEGRIGYGAGKIVGKSVLIFKGVLSNYLFETVS